VLRNVSVLQAAVENLGELQAGHLDVAAPHALAAEFVAPLVGTFLSRHPGVQVRIQTSEDPHDIERYVRSGRCELGFTLEAVKSPLLSEVIGKQESFVVFPRGTKLKRRPVKHADLAGLPVVLLSSSYAYYGGFALEIPSSQEAPELVVQTESREALIPLVLAGAGATFLTRALAEDAASLGAVISELDPPIQHDVHLVRRPDPLSPASRVLAELARSDPARDAPAAASAPAAPRPRRRRRRKNSLG
jgi:DNA-binding transcriptional LysR family regulator